MLFRSKQTLIVITADHETGGMICQPKTPKELARLSIQKSSLGVISENLKRTLREKYSQKPMPWEEVQQFLSDNFGLFSEIKLGWEDEKILKDCYYATLAKKQTGSAKDLYADNAKIVAEAAKIYHRKCGINWVGSHSSSFVPVFAVGVGAEEFTHKTDNAEVARTIMRIAKYK